MLGVNIATAAANKNLTPAELAMDLSLPRRTVMKWAKGYAVPDTEMLKKVAKMLGTSPSKLLEQKVQTDEEIDAALAVLRREAEKKSFKWNILRSILMIAVGFFPMMMQIMNLYYKGQPGGYESATGMAAMFVTGNFDPSLMVIGLAIFALGVWGFVDCLKKR